MQPLEPGVMFWAERDDFELVRGLGVRCGQLGVPGAMRLTEGAAEHWKRTLDGFTAVTVFAAYDGEDYADIATVQRTVGFIPPATRTEREVRTLAVSDFAARLGVGSIACHIGFVPEDSAHPDYVAVREVVRRICDHTASHGQTFALETGQEPAHVLAAFIEDVGRENLKINFDPANLILYGTGEPIPALKELARYIVSVHCKDGDWPAAPGALGVERPLGTGAVGVPAFIQTLKEIGFTSSLNVERECEDQAQRWRDIGAAVRLLRSSAPPRRATLGPA
jgi:sugar phosphate isomerase/epimerase